MLLLCCLVCLSWTWAGKRVNNCHFVLSVG